MFPVDASESFFLFFRIFVYLFVYFVTWWFHYTSHLWLYHYFVLKKKIIYLKKFVVKTHFSSNNKMTTGIEIILIVQIKVLKLNE